MYDDKLDGTITKDDYEKKSSACRAEQMEIRLKIQQHEQANQSYMDEGIKILELMQHAVALYENAEMPRKREILNFVLSNSTWKDGQLMPNYRKPFDLLVVKNLAVAEQKAAGAAESELFKNYLGCQDSNLDRQIQSLQSYR